MYFRVCECCGAYLDPNESCDCQDDEFYFEKENEHDS